MKISIGADHAGFALKSEIKADLQAAGHAITDVGTSSTASCDYPDFAHRLAEGVARDKAVGILVCGTGTGMAMAANRHRGIRAVACSEPYSARMARQHNDANVLCIGARVVGTGLALEIVKAFLGASFEGGRHAPRVAKIDP